MKIRSIFTKRKKKIQSNTIAEERATVERECPDNKFSYTMEKDDSTKVLLLSVEYYSKQNPKLTGNFTTCIDAPDGRVRIIADAITTSPGYGWATLDISFNGTKLFPNPKSFQPLPNGHLGITITVVTP